MPAHLLSYILPNSAPTTEIYTLSLHTLFRSLSAESQQMLEARGFPVVERADEPAALVDGRVLIAVGTDWTNRRCGYAARLETLGRLAEVDAALRIACPHWGYELEANPRPPQVVHAGRLLRQWDAIVGNHSHWPQLV